MKKAAILYWGVVIVVAVLGGWATMVVVEGEYRTDTWNTRMEATEAVMERAKQTQQAQEYSQTLLEVIRELSAQNIWMFNRQTNAKQIVAEFEEENRRLKCSLDDAVDRLGTQQVEINDLIDQNDQLSYKVDVLERALAAIGEESDEEVENLDVVGPADLPVQ